MTDQNDSNVKPKYNWNFYNSMIFFLLAVVSFAFPLSGFATNGGPLVHWLFFVGGTAFIFIGLFNLIRSKRGV